MKIIITKNIDDKEIIIGIGSPSIDPVLTSKAVAEKIKTTDTYKFIEGRKEEIKSKMISAFKSNQNAKSSKDQNEAKKHNEDYILRMGQVKELEREITEKIQELESERVNFATDNAVYFDSKPGEYLKTEAEAAAIVDKMILATQNGSLLSVDEIEIIDNRGIVYWTESPWAKVIIEKIGVEIPSDVILEKDLTVDQKAEIFEQFEVERIAALTNAEKTAEKLLKIDQAAAEADVMRGKLEIQGVSDALAQAQAWYGEQVEAIEVKYG